MGNRYWAFGANPRRYRITDAVRDLRVDRWTVGQSEPAPGDGVIIWKFKGGEDRRGIIALGEILTSPEILGDDENPFWIDRTDANLLKPRVLVRYIHSPNLPLWLHEHSDLLGVLSIAGATGGGVFKVTPEQWQAVLQAAETGEEAAFEAPGTPNELEAYITLSTGQGFRVSAEERQAIEHYAMEQAIAYFEMAGWKVEDVSAHEPFDLRCRQAGQPELHVEVKGSTGDGSKVMLTANEVAHARQQFPNMALVVVSGIRLDMGGRAEVRVIQPWKVDEGSLLPLTYFYTVDPTRHASRG